jgi:predicted transcriptional regulator of viral defense system
MKMRNLERILVMAREKKTLQAKDLTEAGIPLIYLDRLYKHGLLDKIARGLYRLPDAELTEKHSYAAVCKRVPHAVVCLLSALRFHEIGTQLPHQVWIAIDEKARRPKLDYPKIRVLRFSGRARTEGVEEHVVEGVRVRVYNVPKTVVDCFKYRNKIGLDVALEALKEVWREKRCSADDLWRYAKVCRVWNVMRPYLEAQA